MKNNFLIPDLEFLASEEHPAAALARGGDSLRIPLIVFISTTGD